jgi:hypothetical protein
LPLAAVGSLTRARRRSAANVIMNILAKPRAAAGFMPLFQ